MRLGPCLPPPACPSVSAVAGASPRLPPLWVAPGPPLALRWPPHVAWKVPVATQAAPLAWCMHATPPRTSSRLPPRRRRGPARTEPAAPFSRAHQNQGALLDLFPSLSRSFPAQTPQTATTALPNAGEPQAAVEPHLHSRSAQINPASSSYLVPRGSPTLFPLQSFTGASSPLTPTTADRRVTRSRRHEPPRSYLEVLLDPLLLSHPIPSPPMTRSPGNVRSNPASPL